MVGKCLVYGYPNFDSIRKEYFPKNFLSLGLLALTVHIKPKTGLKKIVSTVQSKSLHVLKYQYILSGQAYEAMSRWIRSHWVSKRVLACPAGVVVEGAELPLTDDGRTSFGSGWAVVGDGRYSSIVPHALRQAWGGTSFVVPIFAKYHNTDSHHCFSE
ncbi:hypothetical protein AVEN_36057-1 [Araneus ventricosus]|uniref:Uncharacterized protein n=1 Tax=Araneus ventricosus TaxID=182803 RepID=A0A4Y2JRD6_ARAVE|nr:hypothetical protein AVEN_36057-1 [Araneus ventricosus]